MFKIDFFIYKNFYIFKNFKDVLCESKQKYFYKIFKKIICLMKVNKEINLVRVLKYYVQLILIYSSVKIY